MAKIGRVKRQGQQVFPKTITRAVKDLESGKMLDVVIRDIHRRIDKTGVTNYILANDREIWQSEPLEPYKENDIVYHLGCAWLCMKDDTTEEPTWYTEDWVYLMGDNAFSIVFDSSAGTSFRRGNIDTNIKASIFFGSFEVTEMVMKQWGVGVIWERDTENPPEDSVWTPAYTDASLLGLRISNYDVGYQFFQHGLAKFTLTVSIPTSNGFATATKSINFKG